MHRGGGGLPGTFDSRRGGSRGGRGGGGGGRGRTYRDGGDAGDAGGRRRIDGGDGGYRYGDGPGYRKRRAEDDLGGSQRPAVPGNEYAVELTSNAFKVSLNPKSFKALYVYTVSFSGPRALSIEDENLKKRILGTKSIWGSITCPKLATFRDYEHAKLFVITTPHLDARQQVESLEGSIVHIPAFGRRAASDTSVAHEPEEEEWTVSFKCETKGDGLKSEPQQQTLWLQFAALVAQEALSQGGFTTGRNDLLMRLDQPNKFRPLQSLRGFIVPCFAKSFAYTEHGTFWVFAPKSSLLLDRTMGHELDELMKQDPSYAQSAGSDLPAVLRRRNLMCVTAYCRTNIYKVVGLDLTKKPTDEFKIREKSLSGEWVERSISHIEYLREKYSADCYELSDQSLNHALMVACVLVGKKRQAVRRSKTVYIPAPLLRIVCINPKDLTRQQREEITRASQKKARDCIEEIASLVRDLDKPEVRDAFAYFGLDVQADAMSLQGRNNVRQSVVISVCAPGQDRRMGSTEIYLDQQANFMRDFTSMKSLCNPPPLKSFITIARLDHGRIPDRWCDVFFTSLEGECRKWGWQLEVSMRPQDLRVIGWDGSFQHLEEIRQNLTVEFQEERNRPDLIWGMLAERDEVEYAMFKRFAYQLEVPSQAITMSTLRRLGGKAFWKMLAAVAAKVVPVTTNGRPCQWTVPWQLKEGPLHGREHAAAVGIATYQSSAMRKSNTGAYGLCATVNQDCTGIVQDYGETSNISSGGIFGDLKDKFEKLYKELITRYSRKPDTLFIYRKGVSEGMFDQLQKAEITQIEAALDGVVGKRQWNASERTLTISQPRTLRERGQYEFSVPCACVDAGGHRLIKTVHKTAAATPVVGPDGTRSSGLFEFHLSFTEEEGVPDIYNPTPIGAKLPSGHKGPLDKRPQVAYIVVNHCHSANLLFFAKRDSLPPGGTVIDEWFRGVDTKGKTREEFFIIPGAGPVGFAGPVHYSVIQNKTAVPTREIELISLRLCFLFFNQQGSVKIPFMLRFAELGAEKACTIYHQLETSQHSGKRNRLRETHFLL